MQRISRRLALAAALPLIVAALTGCAYLKNRGNDALDIFDVGITFSSEPHVGVYAGFESLLSAGYADVEGKMLGLGNRRAGWLDMKYKAAGALLEGHEEWAYGDYENDPSLRQNQGAGLGLLYDDVPRTVPKFLNCPKFVHLFFIGANVNCKIGEVLDFVLGWTTLDIGCDDVYGDGKAESAG